MDMGQTTDLHSHLSRPGYLAEVTMTLLHIRDTRGSGRLSIRNAERFGLAHLYFNGARLIHITGDKHDGEAILNDLLTWSKGSVRFDDALMVNYESVTWQQAQIFTRWLAFLEMRGIMQGIARTRLDGLARSLTANLPGEPIALPEEVEHYGEYDEATRIRQWQRLNEGVHYLIEYAITDEQRQQLKLVSQRVNGVMQQAGGATQELAKRAARTTQDGLRQAAEVAQEAARQGAQRAEELVRQTLNQDRRQQFIQSTQRTVDSVRQAAEVAQEAARQSAQRAEELMRQTFNEERRQQIILSMQETVESVKQTVSQTVSQRVEDAFSQRMSPLPPELQARSIRPMRSFQTPSPVIGGPGKR